MKSPMSLQQEFTEKTCLPTTHKLYLQARQEHFQGRSTRVDVLILLAIRIINVLVTGYR